MHTQVGSLVHSLIQARPSCSSLKGVLRTDHYQGITDNWNQGIIHCSPVTGKLIQHLLGVRPEFVHTLAVDQVHHIQGIQPFGAAAQIYTKVTSFVQWLLHVADALIILSHQLALLQVSKSL